MGKSKAPERKENKLNRRFWPTVLKSVRLWVKHGTRLTVKMVVMVMATGGTGASGAFPVSMSFLD